MAKAVSEITLGVDVSKDELVICDWDTQQLTRLANQPDQIKAWLGTLNGPARIAVESTSNYHLELVEQLHTQDLTVYLVNPRALTHYRKAVDLRNKTDPDDAWLLARYLAHEGAALQPLKPRSAAAQRLWALIKRRGVIVKTRQTLQQSFTDIKLPAKTLFGELRNILVRIDRMIQTLLRQLGWRADYLRCLSIPGLGPANAAALTAVYHRGAFASSDTYIAFIGLDVRIRESGKFTGQRKLSKCGEAEIRRLLYCATQPARSYHLFDAYYHRQLDKGLSKIAAKVILARKLARIAFALMANQTTFVKHQIG